jgi:hypothetical protein
MDSPACRVVSAAARADVRAKGAEVVTSLAIGAAIAVTALTDMLAGHKGMTAEDLLESLDTVEKPEPGMPASFAATPVIRSTRCCRTSPAPEPVWPSASYRAAHLTSTPINDGGRWWTVSAGSVVLAGVRAAVRPLSR